jgi:putative ABC transport system ATP-binding protein
MALIEVQGIGRTYGRGESPVVALHGVDLEVEECGFVALMGPSGSGKSTLLGILGAMSPPTTGHVLVDGIDVYALHHERRADFRREYLGFVFQQLYLVPYLTAIENVCLPLAAAGLPNARQHEMATAALGRVGLEGKADRLPQALSGGEQQRVAIARAVVNNPRIILADEPTGCLDSQNGRAIMELFGELRQSGLTIFMVTHDATIASYADRIVHLRDGCVAGHDALYAGRDRVGPDRVMKAPATPAPGAFRA